MTYNLHFSKYQGTGNDFVMIDNRDLSFPKENTKLVAFLCDRRFGIGGDGLILIENDLETNFKMIYYNSDGNESTMCGNGGRCLVAFAKQLKIISNSCTFKAIDGLHHAKISDEIISLQMIDVQEISKSEKYTFLNTGSPHHVQMVDEVKNYDVYNKGKEIRYADIYAPGGTNVNFVEKISDNYFKVRTYERGVEDETFSCGTGATAVAIAMFENEITNKKSIQIEVPGGMLNVSFDKNEAGFYENVILSGPAKKVFESDIIVDL
ncbi:diaminopimelate epimerase [Flavobacterium sp. I3-2]|uniref:diaminopimelate epimerase n=1 Tax=Flavobacterium sp. I3-2 TaxID=2748319 RepID=UPI0015A845D9|nr:diaminopimelate epimerase [Flavobacterium sp. I3-2]